MLTHRVASRQTVGLLPIDGRVHETSADTVLMKIGVQSITVVDQRIDEPRGRVVQILPKYTNLWNI